MEDLTKAELYQKTSQDVQQSEIPTFDILVKTELKKFDEVTPKINELSKEFMPLKIESVTDKDGYEKVQKALTFMIKKRTAIEAKRKELKSHAIIYGNAVDAKAEEITLLLSPIEEYLRTQKETIDAEKLKIEQQKEKEKQAKKDARVKLLLDLGMYTQNGNYIWSSRSDTGNSIRMPAEKVEILSDEQFAANVEKITELKNEDEERIRKETETRLEQGKRLAEEKKKLEDEQEKFRLEKQKAIDEIAAIKKQITDSRLQVLFSLGLKLSDLTGFLFYENSGVPLITLPEILQIDAANWDYKMVEIKGRINNIIIQQRDAVILKEKKDAEEKLRLQKQADENAAKKIEADKKAEEARKAEADKLEKERVAALSDKQKISEYAKKLGEFVKPELKTAKWNKELKTLVETINNYI